MQGGVCVDHRIVSAGVSVGSSDCNTFFVNSIQTIGLDATRPSKGPGLGAVRFRPGSAGFWGLDPLSPRHSSETSTPERSFGSWCMKISTVRWVLHRFSFLVDSLEMLGAWGVHWEQPQKNTVFSYFLIWMLPEV